MAKSTSSAKGIDFRRVLKKYAKNWYVFVIAIFVALLYAQDANKYIEPIYSLNTSLLIENKSNKSVLEERGSISENPLYLNQKLIENQIAYLKSYNLVKKIVEKLDIIVSYYQKDQFYWKDIYKESPFVVDFMPDHQQIRYKLISVTFNDKGSFTLSSENKVPLNVNQIYKIDELIRGDDYEFRIALKKGKTIKDIKNKVYGFQINDVNGLTSQYIGKTNVFIRKNTSILMIGTSGPNIQKEKDYLNTLTAVFLEINLDKKNQILNNTLKFINSQLLNIGNELYQVEQRLEDFRKANQFMELSSKAAALLRELDNQRKSRSELLLDQKYYEYLQDYLIAHDKFEDIVMPSTVGLSLPLFSDLVLKLSTVSLEKEDLIANSSRENPYIITLEKEIENNKTALKENMSSIIATTKIKIDDMDQRIMATREQFSRLPSIEREHLEIQRKYKVFNTLYDFLLKRKSEVEIQHSANLSDHEIFDRAGDNGIATISKQPKSNYINALIWALLIPSVFLFLIVFLNDRVLAEEDILSITDIPIVGSVIRVSGRKLATPNSYFSETLRLIRIKLNLSPLKGEKIVLVTSSTMEEGKSFISENLALVYAMTGKTLLLSFDLRRPSLNTEFSLKKAIGFSDFLMNKVSLDEAIFSSSIANLDILVSGPFKANPDELIDSVKTEEMFSVLREKYQHIVIDTAPLGLVGDAYLLNKYSDATLFVVRNNFTKKKVFANTIHEAKSNQMKNINIVFNEVENNVKDINKKIYGETIKPYVLPVRVILKIRRVIVDILRKI